MSKTSMLCSAVQRNRHDHRWHGYKTCSSRQFSVSLSFLSDPPCMHLPVVCAQRTHIHMRTLTTVTYSSQIDGRHSQKDSDSLTSDFILYLPPALLTLLSRAKLWALVQGLQSVSRQAVRTTAQTYSATAFTVEPLYPQAIPNQRVAPSRVKEVRVCKGAPMLQRFTVMFHCIGANHVLRQLSGVPYCLTAA